MRALWLIVLLCVGCGSGGFHSGPVVESSPERREKVRPRYVEPVRSVVGLWEVSCDHPSTGWLTFTVGVEESGGLDWGFPNDDTANNDVWWQEGEEVHFFINNAYVDYAGQLLNGDELQGVAMNVNGTVWEFTAHRLE